MEKNRLLIVGLEEAELQTIKQGVSCLVVVYNMLPNIKLIEGTLWVESTQVPDKYLEVNQVIYHGIFEDDYDFITLLALWNGACLPNAQGMMDCRLRHAGLVRAVKVSKFGNMPRGMSLKTQTWHTTNDTVGKWGNWHCGENKHRFTGEWQASEATVYEPFIKGEAVRIMIVGEQHWQIKLAGESWLKSIHHNTAGEMPIDADLLADGYALAHHFELQTVGIDYMIADSGEKYLLEVNHIPNVTVFPFVNEAYLKFAIAWVQQAIL
jgi:hypothetical protein